MITIGANIFFGQYYSIEGFDRIRDGLAYEVRANDEFFDAEAWLRTTVYKDFYGEVRYGEHRREGQLAEFFADETMRDWTFKVGTLLVLAFRCRQGCKMQCAAAFWRGKDR